MFKASAKANSNIALIKYWGKRDRRLNLPAVGSISITLDGLSSDTSVEFNPELERDELILNNALAAESDTKRVSEFLDLVRVKAGMEAKAIIKSENNFPTAAGLASSASAFAALAGAASKAAGLELSFSQLSELARQGSGSAARSVFGGFVEMHRGRSDDGSDAIAKPLAAADFWDLRLIIAITSEQPKKTGSTRGMNLSGETSIYYPAWVDAAEKDLAEMRAAIRTKDFSKLGELSEFSCLKMHALAMSGRPGILYWNAATVESMHMVRKLRASGTEAYFTIDAGPQVKVLCLREDAALVKKTLEALPGVLRTIQTKPGTGLVMEVTPK